MTKSRPSRPKHKRRADRKPDRETRESEMLRIARHLYREGLAARLFNYGTIAERAGLNRVTVQRVLAATNCQRHNTGRSTAHLELILQAMGYTFHVDKLKAAGEGAGGTTPPPPVSPP